MGSRRFEMVVQAAGRVCTGAARGERRPAGYTKKVMPAWLQSQCFHEDK